MSWHVTHRYPAYSAILVEEPVVAEIFRGTIRRLPGSPLMLIAAQTWGMARQKMGSEHVYAIVYWPDNRPRPEWLLIIYSPSILPGSAVKMLCQR
jgi:hypothetical protein